MASALPGSTAADLLLPETTGSGAVAAAAAAGGIPLAGPGDAPGGAVAAAAPGSGAEDGGAQPLAWLPPTAAAVGMRLLSLDASLFYKGGVTPARERLEVGGTAGISLGLDFVGGWGRVGRGRSGPSGPWLWCAVSLLFPPPLHFRQTLHTFSRASSHPCRRTCTSSALPRRRRHGGRWPAYPSVSAGIRCLPCC